MTSYNASQTCGELSGGPYGRPPISIHRTTGKDIMPFREGVRITTYMNDYIPPALSPGYMGQLSTIAKCSGGGCGGPDIRFKNYRNDLLARVVCPKFLFGRFPTSYTPCPDVAAAEKVVPWKKLSDLPVIRPLNVCPCRSGQIEEFYTDYHKHRDYYLDRTGKHYPAPSMYHGHPYPVRCPVDERVFKIRRFQDSCELPGYIGPKLNCHSMPCIRGQGFLTPFDLPKLPREPFLCDRIKPKNPNEHEVLLV